MDGNRERISSDEVARRSGRRVVRWARQRALAIIHDLHLLTSRVGGVVDGHDDVVAPFQT